jgi:hypothetical protein
MTAPNADTSSPPPAGTRDRGKSARRWIARGALVIGAMVLVVVLAGLPLYVFPPVDDDVQDADLAYVIGPATSQRITLAQELLDDGTVDEILISVAGGGVLGADAIDACKDPAVTCEHPNPFTTKGEVDALAEFAAANEVDKTIVITFAPHVLRTRFIFEKCFAGDVTVIAAPQKMDLADWVYQYAYQTAAFAKAWLRPCASTD